MISYFHTRRVFLACLAVVYFTAFASLWPQALGLWGSQGILPAAEFLSLAGAEAPGAAAYWFFPTVFWLQSSDAALVGGCALGVACSVLILLDLAPAVLLFVNWFLYLSLVTVGGDFMHFQWDVLLLEAGFLAIFFAPWRLRRPEAGTDEEPSALMVWLFRWLVFKLMFFSGFSKLASGDTVWRNLEALQFHYQTQPLPPWTAWYAHQWPTGFQTVSCFMMFAVELGAPFLIFLGRRPRGLACAALLTLQGFIIATGNYGIFNWLSIALCFLLLDDGAFSFLGKVPHSGKRKPVWLTGTVFLVISLLSVSHLMSVSGITRSLPEDLQHVRGNFHRIVAPFNLVNSYGLFAVMTTKRSEIIVEGSDDGKNWLAYEFKFKPGSVDRRPAFVAPFHPRLDWQMWFAALNPPHTDPWFLRFCERILRGSPTVLKLLRSNPFQDKPPRYVRALLFDYRFSTPALKTKGQWWVREERGARRVY